LRLIESEHRREARGNLSANNGFPIASEPGVRQQPAIFLYNAEMQLGFKAKTLKVIFRR
jgi:hypothetical protein